MSAPVAEVRNRPEQVVNLPELGPAERGQIAYDLITRVAGGLAARPEIGLGRVNEMFRRTGPRPPGGYGQGYEPNGRAVVEVGTKRYVVRYDRVAGDETEARGPIAAFKPETPGGTVREAGLTILISDTADKAPQGFDVHEIRITTKFKEGADGTRTFVGGNIVSEIPNTPEVSDMLANTQKTVDTVNTELSDILSPADPASAIKL